MKLMKARNKMKNMMIQEFQHSVEFQLIEAMMLQMQMIRFDRESDSNEIDESD
jgi:hypothetical protein